MKKIIIFSLILILNITNLGTCYATLSNEDFLFMLEKQDKLFSQSGIYRANYNIFSDYYYNGLITYDRPFNLPGEGPKLSSDTKREEYRYLGYTYEEEPFTNTFYPADSSVVNPYDWKHIQISGAKESWNEINKYPEIFEHVYNSPLTYSGVEYSDLKVSNSIGGIDKNTSPFAEPTDIALIQCMPSWNSTFSILTNHMKGSNVWYATFNGPSLGKASLLCRVETDDLTYTITSTSNQVAIPFSVISQLILKSTVVNSMNISQVESIVSGSLQGEIKKSNTDNCTYSDKIILTRDDFPSGEWDIDIKGYSSVLSVFGDVLFNSDKKTIKLIVEEGIIPSVIVNAYATPNRIIEPKIGDEIEIFFTANIQGKEANSWKVKCTSEGYSEEKYFDNRNNISGVFKYCFDSNITVADYREFKVECTAFYQEGDVAGVDEAVVNLEKKNSCLPKAVIRCPEYCYAGDLVYISGESSFDPDNDIVEYIWDVPNSTIFVDGVDGNICFPGDFTGVVAICLTVIDSMGNQNSTTKNITVRDYQPKIRINVEGCLKENRKVIVTGINEGIYNIRNDVEYIVTPINNQEGEIIVINNGISADMLFREMGKYRVGIRGRDTAGNAFYISKDIEIKEDLSPTAELLVPKILLRRLDGESAQLTVEDISYSSDGDNIHVEEMGYIFDENNNGTFEEKIVGVSIAQDAFLDHVGKYKIVLKVKEGFGQETIEEYISEENYKTNTIEEIVEVQNKAPQGFLYKEESQDEEIRVYINTALNAFDDSKALVAEINSLIENNQNIDICNSVYQENFTTPKIYSYNNYNICIDYNGEVWGAGENTYAQLGIYGKPIESYRKIDGLHNIIFASAGKNHALFVNSEGNVFASGNNSFKQRGECSSVAENRYIYKLFNLENIVQVAAGYKHSLALDENGEVYAWGDNGFGQLGVEGIGGAMPIKIEGLENIVMICAGKYHSLALDSEGKIYAWGSNMRGELGIGSFASGPDIKCLDQAVFFKSIKACDNTSSAVDSNGDIYVWGNGMYGQIGNGSFENQLIPVKVNGIENVEDFDVSELLVSVLQEDGSVYYWGKRNKLTYSSPFEVLESTQKDFKRICVGTTHISMIDNKGYIISLGANIYGAFGINETLKYWRNYYSQARNIKVIPTVISTHNEIDDSQVFFNGENTRKIFVDIRNGKEEDFDYSRWSDYLLKNDIEYYALCNTKFEPIAKEILRNTSQNGRVDTTKDWVYGIKKLESWIWDYRKVDIFINISGNSEETLENIQNKMENDILPVLENCNIDAQIQVYDGKRIVDDRLFYIDTLKRVCSYDCTKKINKVIGGVDVREIRVSKDNQVYFGGINGIKVIKPNGTIETIYEQEAFAFTIGIDGNIYFKGRVGCNYYLMKLNPETKIVEPTNIYLGNMLYDSGQIMGLQTGADGNIYFVLLWEEREYYNQICKYDYKSLKTIEGAFGSSGEFVVAPDSTVYFYQFGLPYTVYAINKDAEKYTVGEYGIPSQLTLGSNGELYYCLSGISGQTYKNGIYVYSGIGTSPRKIYSKVVSIYGCTPKGQLVFKYGSDKYIYYNDEITEIPVLNIWSVAQITHVVEEKRKLYSYNITQGINEIYTRSNADLFYVHIDDDYISNLNKNLENLIKANNSALVILGSNNNESQSKEYLSDKRGKYIKNEDIDDALWELCEYIYDNAGVAKKQDITTVLLNEKTEYSMYYYDYENDPINSVKYMSEHTNDDYFDEAAKGLDPDSFGKYIDSGVYKNENISMISKTGLYNLYVKVQDNPSKLEGFDEYMKYNKEIPFEVLVHHRPIAKFEMINTSDGFIPNNLSYDIDHALSETKGIVLSEYSCREEGEGWQKGYIPDNYDNVAPYYIRLIVTDIEGAMSHPYTVLFSPEGYEDVNIQASLSCQKDEFTLDSIPASESLILDNISVDIVGEIRLVSSIYKDGVEVASQVNIELDYTQNGFSFYKPNIFKTPKELKDDSYEYILKCYNFSGTLLGEKKFDINLHTPVNLVVPNEFNTSSPGFLDVIANASYYVGGISGTINWDGVQKSYNLINTRNNLWEGRIEVPNNLNSENYNICFTAVSYNNNIEQKNSTVNLASIDIDNVSVEGYWNRWRGREDFFNNYLENDAHRFVSMEKIKIVVSTSGNVEKIEIRMSPELESMIFKSDDGNWYGYGSYANRIVKFPEDSSMVSDMPKDEEIFTWEYVLPLATETINKENIRIASPYWIEITAYGNETEKTYLVDDIDITGNIYDYIYTQPVYN